ncbi:hypothetical protein [Nonomuraea typhae]|uniref:Uncharacterized protein n=1 Tax=Nonomuraea typhae TaxID=2603600 RepID=A0ABW7YKB3_9ACTN
MTPLEERLKTALDARAQTFEVSQNAWLEVRRRTPLPPRRARWLLAAVPVVMIALFVPVLLNGGLGRNSANDPDTVYRQLMAELTPLGDPVELGEAKLWFAKGKLGNPVFCMLARRGQEPYGSCGGVSALGKGTHEGSLTAEDAATVLSFGLVVPEATQVRALTGDGRRIPGAIHRVAGAPVSIWTLSVPAAEQVAKVEFVDAGQRVLGETSWETLRSRRNAKPAGPPYELPGALTLRPYLVPNETQPGATDLTVIWERGGREVSSLSLKARDLWKGGDRDYPVLLQAEDGVVFGAARPDVARIEVSLNGKALTLTPRPDPWQLSVGLFAQPADVTSEMGSFSITAFDARGAEIWRSEPKRPRARPSGKRIGALAFVHGTEDFALGPVQVWYQKGPEGVELCSSGGVRPDGSQAGGCSSADTDRNVFQRFETVSYLPEPGARLAFGVLPGEAEAVTAVTADGTRLPAALVPVKGGPAPVWAIRYPRDTEIAAFAVREKGRELERIVMMDRSCWKADRPEGRGQTLAGGVSAHISAPSCLHFWKDGKPQPGSFDRLPGTALRHVLGKERPVQWSEAKGVWYGFALAGTARVEGVSKTGRVSAQTVPDPWGHGVVLFAAPTPAEVAKKGLNWPGLSFTGYAADGSVLWEWKNAELS